MASLKPDKDDRFGVDRFPFHGRKIMASLKLRIDAVIPRLNLAFHGRKIMASLKPNPLSQLILPSTHFPWSKDHGLIEAQRREEKRRV